MNNIDRKLIEMGLMEAEPGWFKVFLEHLRAFKAEHGHCKVTKEHVCPDGYTLGPGVGRIRTGNNRVTAEQRTELDAIGFIWNASTTGAWWPDFIRNLKAFVSEHGHCKVPVALAWPEGYKLGPKVQMVRSGANKVTEEQRAALDALGFIWDGKLWYPEFLKHLQAFKADHGHCRVPQSWVCSDGYKLGSKVSCVRHGANPVTEKQRTELDTLGFTWDAHVWYPEFLQYLGAFMAEKGHCNVPVAYVCPEGYKIGRKINGIRSEALKLTKEQRAELTSLGFLWDAQHLSGPKRAPRP